MGRTPIYRYPELDLLRLAGVSGGSAQPVLHHRRNVAGRAAAATCERGSIRPRGPPRASTATPLRPDPLHMTASGIDGAARPRGGMGLPVEAGPERARPRTTGCFPDSTVLLLPGTGGPGPAA